MTKRQKTTFFDIFGLPQAFFNNFLTISPKWENIEVLSPFQRRYSVKIFSVYDYLSLFCFVVHPEWFLNENMSSPAGLNKTFSFFLQKYHLWPFLGTEVQLQSYFFQPRLKIFGISSRTVIGNIVPSVELSVSTGMCFLKVNIFRNPWFYLIVFQRCVLL